MMRDDAREHAVSAPDPNATGAPQALPSTRPGVPGRESHERQAALARAEQSSAEPSNALCEPDLPELSPHLLFTLIADSVREYAIFLTDRDGIIRCWGEGARLMKWWTKAQAEGSHLRMLYPDGGSEDGTAEAHLQIAAERGEYTGEGHRVRNDGSTFWAYVTLTALRDSSGRLAGFSKVTRDFTARRAVEASLRERAHAERDAQRILDEANRRKALVATISHELRAPLNAILGNLALLEGDAGKPGRQQEQIDRLKRSARHLLEMIKDVLDISRAEAGALAVNSSSTRLGPAVLDAISDVEADAATRGLTLINRVSGAATDLPYVGDEARVRQIVVNLLTNALKFTGRGGRITISAGAAETVSGAELVGTGPWVYVRVEDTGRGIAPERLHAIFEPYQQSELADQDRGTGLGLAISRQLARAMSGDITVQSHVGVGSTFTLWLPMAASEPVPR